VRKRKLATFLVSGKRTCAVTVNSFNSLEFLIGFCATFSGHLVHFRHFYKLNAKDALCADDVRPSVSVCPCVT